jgi:hypothetical protein
MKTIIIIVFLFLFSILILPISIFGIAYGSTDTLVLELRKQFNAEHGCNYWKLLFLADEIEKGTGIGELGNECHIYYYDCMVALNEEEAKPAGKNLTSVIVEKDNQKIPLEKLCK